MWSSYADSIWGRESDKFYRRSNYTRRYPAYIVHGDPDRITKKNGPLIGCIRNSSKMFKDILLVDYWLLCSKSEKGNGRKTPSIINAIGSTILLQQCYCTVAVETFLIDPCVAFSDDDADLHRTIVLYI